MGVSAGHGFIVIVHHQTVRTLASLMAWTLVLEKPLEPGDDLLERLFADGPLMSHRIEIRLVHAFGKQASKSPVRHDLGDVEHGAATLLPSEVNVGLGVAEVFCEPACGGHHSPGRTGA